MVLRAFFDSGYKLGSWSGIVSAVSLLMALMMSPTVKAADGIFKCDFESDLCGIQQTGSDWVRKSGATSSMDAGPEGGHDQSKFYLFPDNLKKHHASEFSSPDLTSTGVVCIQFAYTTYGTKVGKMIVYAQKGSQTATRKEIWQSEDGTVRSWVVERLPYSLESGERIIWRAISGGTGEETAVDSIIITKGSCLETCLGTQWKVEKDVVSPGGIYMANLNTGDLCKDACILRSNCLATDVISEGSQVLCYHHIKTFSLQEVIKVPMAWQHTITGRCGVTDVVEATPTPGTASGCRPMWSKRNYFYSLGGSLRPEIRSASACRDACLQERACIAVDIQWSGNVMDDSLVCRIHVDRTKLLAPLLMANTEQWELVERCSVVDVEKSRGFVHKSLEGKGCLGQWEERSNTHYVGGSYFTAPNNVVLMPRTCLAECLGEPSCVAVDINFGRSPIECWLYSSIADRSKFYSTANIRHYYLVKRCASDKEVLIPEDEGSGSDIGEGSGAPPETFKPEVVCKTVNWERQPGFYSLGGTRHKSKTLEQCFDDCLTDAKCQGIDYHEQDGCVVHRETADFYYALAGPGWIQYQLISDCAKTPEKVLPGKADIRPDCTKGVIQKEFMRSPGAIFYTKVSSTWQCLDTCVHSKKCLAAEIRKVDRGLNCYYHYKNIKFDILLSSNDAVLYVLNKQCVRLRDSDLMPTPGKTLVTPIPIVDLDKDDTYFIEAEATYCEDAMCYLVMKAKFNWKNAQTDCEMKHGKLVSVKSVKIQNIIEKILKIHKITESMWIGATLINEIAFTNQSVSLWRVVQGTGLCETEKTLGAELLDRAVMSQGCYMEAKDEKEKEFMHIADVPAKNLTPASCLAECRKQKFQYAGVQDGSVCACGNSFGMYGPAQECAEPCLGDYSQHCGGVGAHAVFKASAISEDFSMWQYNEPKNMSNGQWCGAIDMFELDEKKKLASRLCAEDQKFICQLTRESCETGPDIISKWGICIYFSTEELSWYQARAHCHSLRGDLLILDSEEKREGIQADIKAHYPQLSKRYIWIGLYSRVYYWDDLGGGSELCYNKFSRGEPVFQKNCLYLDPKTNFEWFSGSCESENHEFICEIDTSKGELPPVLASRPPIQEHVKIAEEDRWQVDVELPAEKKVAASTDLRSGGGTGLSAVEIALVAGIGVVAVALLIGGTMYGISKQRNRGQQQGDVEMRQHPHDKGPAEPAQPESKAASGQASSLSQHQADTQSEGSPSARPSRESQLGHRMDLTAGSGLDSTSGGAPLSASASSAGGGSTRGE